MTGTSFGAFRPWVPFLKSLLMQLPTGYEHRLGVSLRPKSACRGGGGFRNGVCAPLGRHDGADMMAAFGQEFIRP